MKPPKEFDAFTEIVDRVLAVPNSVVKERLDRCIRSLDATLEKRPKVFNSVRVNLAVNVLLRVVNDLMDVILMKSAVALPAVREQVRARLDVAPHFGVQGQLRSVADNLR